MVRQRTKVSIVGMTLGVVIVAALGLMAGIGVIPSLAISLIGLFLGGWTAERLYEEETPVAESSSDKGTA